jgi:hypothetical protein
MLEERLNYHTVLSTENDIAKSLTYEEEVKDHAAKKCIGSIVEVCQAVN